MSPHFRLAAVLIALALAPALAGCAATAIGAGAAGGSAAVQERGFSGAVADSRIRVQINDLWFKADERMYRKVSLQVQQGRVLITGLVDDPEMRRRAAELAWQADDVKEVINEVDVTEDGGAGTYARDTWISTQLKGKLLADSEIMSLNYSIETANGRIYIIGIARSQEELDRVLDHARNISRVREVVNYIQVQSQAGDAAA